MDVVRIDRWLCAARLYKSRTAAQEACLGGHVRINDQTARPSHPLRVGDRVEALAPRGRVIAEVLALGEKRLSPAAARLLYADHSPPPPPPEVRQAVRDRGAGRPTKAERRQIERLRGQ